MEHVSLLINPKCKHEVHDSRVGAVTISDKIAGEFTGCSPIVAAGPYFYFAKVIRLFSPVIKACGGVHPTAVVELSVTMPDNCEIGVNAYIGTNTVLGEDCRTLVNVVVQYDCKLNSGAVLRPNVVVYYGCMFGNRVEIHSGAVIDADDSGPTFTGDSWFKIPQAGAVTLDDGVEIDSNSNIGRGTMSDTIVGNGTKTDSQVQIGHNYKTGPHTVTATETDISDSVAVDNYCIIGDGVGMVGHIEIADETTIDGGTSVTHSTIEGG